MERISTEFLPSCKMVTYRETNGDDDGMVSRIADIANGDNFTNFISSIVIKDEQFLNGKPSPQDVKQWKTNDRFSLLLKQRIFNRGAELEFEHICSNPKCERPNEQTRNLSDFDTNFEEVIKMNRDEQDQFFKANPDKLPPYPMQQATSFEFNVEGLGRLQMDILTTQLEQDYEKKVGESRNSNSMLLMRNLRMLKREEWIPITFFTNISSRVMDIIRAHVHKFDRQWNPSFPIECPNCQQVDLLNPFLIPAFYFPVVKI